MHLEIVTECTLLLMTAADMRIKGVKVLFIVMLFLVNIAVPSFETNIKNYS